MKNLHILIMLLSLTAIAACGVKSNLDHPSENYPRTYPTR
ncbi:MAG: lipoprotein [Rickettsiales bacterium]|nr:lipoprotein [Rickettsiales bacterium]